MSTFLLSWKFIIEKLDTSSRNGIPKYVRKIYDEAYAYFRIDSGQKKKMKKKKKKKSWVSLSR